MMISKLKMTRSPVQQRPLGLAILLALVLAISLASAAADSSLPSSSKTTGSGSQSTSSSSSTATQSRQSTATMLGTLGSLVPGLITNVAPLVLLFGLGAMMVPALGMSAMGLLRESRRSSNGQDQLLANMQLPAAFAQYARPLQTSPQELYYFTQRSFPGLMSSFNSANLAHGLNEIFVRVVKAIENADKQYK